MQNNQTKKQNIAAFYLQNSLYWLYNKLKIEKKEIEIYINGNEIRVEPKGDMVIVYKNDINIGEYP